VAGFSGRRFLTLTYQGSSMKVVKFLERMSPYQPGEIAGFPDDVAKGYVDGKKAEYVTPAKAGKKVAGTGTEGDGSPAGDGTGGNPSDTPEA